MNDADTYLTRHRDAILADFTDLLRIPSVSTDPAFADDVLRAARWVGERMESAGLSASIHATEGHPVVVGRHHAGPDAPTLLVYAHYDVQPPDPLDEWDSPPFEPEIREGIVYARGAADDKAQVVLQIAAAEAALAAGELPVNLVLLFEGEEEVGSPGLVPFVRERAAELAADHAVIADSMMFAPDRPSLIFGMRGMAYVEVEVRTADHDLHSGQYGGAVPNPAHVLSSVVASLHDEAGRVAVEGFYDDVAEVPGEVREAWAALGFDEEAYRASAGGAPLAGEAGYTGPGKKTVLPSTATAKVSCRLVPDQDPDRIADLLERHVRDRVPEGVGVEVRRFQANPPWRADPRGPLYRAAAS